MWIYELNLPIPLPPYKGIYVKCKQTNSYHTTRQALAQVLTSTRRPELSETWQCQMVVA